MPIDINEISGPEGDSFTFDNVGDIAKGLIVHIGDQQRTNKFNGKLERVLRIALEQPNGETIIIWPVIDTNVEGDGWPNRMAKAIAAAVRAKGRNQLEEGGTLAVKFNATEPNDTANPTKLYVAQYEPPVVTAAQNDPGAPFDDGAVDDLF